MKKEGGEEEGEEDSKSNEPLPYRYISTFNFFCVVGKGIFFFALCYELGGGSSDRSTLLVVDVM